MHISIQTAGIIAEYNPFHNGHRYLNERLREMGYTHIVAVMSGAFVQRGEPALFSKWARAAAALKNGVDLVFELPVSYALGSAERFAAGAVGLMSAAGCIDSLAFGSECGSLAALTAAAEACQSVCEKKQLTSFLKEGLSYPAARQRAVAQTAGEEIADLLACPNNTLGIEYLKAMKRQNAPFGAVTVPRIGAAHDGAPAGGFASASYLRRAFRSGTSAEAIEAYIPAGLGAYYQQEGFAVSNRLESAILFRLREMTAAEFALLPDVTEGLENRLYEAARSAVSVEDFLTRVKTKRYTHARLRRTVFHAMLGLRREDMISSPPYLRILGFTSRGRELLRLMKQTAGLPLVGSFTELEALSSAAGRFGVLERRATDLRGLAVDPPVPCGRDFTEKMIALT